MGRQVLPLTVDRLPLLVEPCSSCVFWECTPAQTARPTADLADVKRVWLWRALQEWGSPGRIALVDGTPAGFVTYAPAGLVPRAMAFPTAPVSEDAVALITARIADEYAGQGLGRMLIQQAAKDILRHGVRAIEVFATTTAPPPGSPVFGRFADMAGQPDRPSPAPDTLPAAEPQRRTRVSIPTVGRPEDAENGASNDSSPVYASSSPIDTSVGHVAGTSGHRSGSVPGRAEEERTVAGPTTHRAAGDDPGDDRAAARRPSPEEGQWRPTDRLLNAWGPTQCLLPVDFLTAVGFYAVRDHPRYPRMRLDLRTVLIWREAFGLAVERLFTPVRSLGGRRPVGTVN